MFSGLEAEDSLPERANNHGSMAKVSRSCLEYRKRLEGGVGHESRCRLWQSHKWRLMEVMAIANRQGWKDSSKTGNLAKVSPHDKYVLGCPDPSSKGLLRATCPQQLLSLSSFPCAGNYVDTWERSLAGVGR